MGRGGREGGEEEWEGGGKASLQPPWLPIPPRRAPAPTSPSSPPPSLLSHPPHLLSPSLSFPPRCSHPGHQSLHGALRPPPLPPAERRLLADDASVEGRALQLALGLAPVSLVPPLGCPSSSCFCFSSPPCTPHES